jgi:hypothetical protein
MLVAWMPEYNKAIPAGNNKCWTSMTPMKIYKEEINQQKIKDSQTQSPVVSIKVGLILFHNPRKILVFLLI